MAELFEFQKIGAAWLKGKKCALLADEMGLGKSAQVVVASRGLDKILILCPAIARVNWDREFTKFNDSTRQFQIIKTGKTIPDPNNSIICSYELAVSLWKSGKWRGLEFDLLVLDEAHFLKNKDAKRTKAVMGNKGLCRQSKRVWCLSGTPMPNHPGELWVLLFTFGVTALTYRDFISKFCAFANGSGVNDPMMQIVGLNKHNVNELREMLKKVSLRRLKKDVMRELPDIFYQDVLVEPGKVLVNELFPNRDCAEVMDTLQKESAYVDFYSLEVTAGSVSTLRKYIGAQKIEPASELVAWELEVGLYEKIVLFCVHQVVVEGLMSRLAKFNPVCVYGKTKIQDRQDAIDRFQNDDLCKVFIANIKAAGTAITLTASDQVLFVEQEWTPGDNAQAVMRVHRIGQKRNVTARFLGVAASIDEKISAVVRRKTLEITSLLDK